MPPEPAAMSVEASSVDAQTTVVAIAGEVTFSNVNGLGRELAAALKAGARNLVVDLSEVTFIDSSGLSALLTASAQARERGGAVALVHGARRPPSIFRFRGVERLLSLYDEPRRGAGGHPVQLSLPDLGRRAVRRVPAGASALSPWRSVWCCPAGARAAPTRRARCPSSSRRWRRAASA